MTEDSNAQKIDSRITQAENSISHIEGRFKEHEKFVREKFSNLEIQNRASENNIISKIGEISKDLQVKISETERGQEQEVKELQDKFETSQQTFFESRRVSGSFVVTIVGLVWAISMVLVAWGASQYSTSKINEVKYDFLSEKAKEHDGMPAHGEVAKDLVGLDKSIERIDERYGILSVNVKELQTQVNIMSTNRFTGKDGEALENKIEQETDNIYEILREELIRSNAADAEHDARLDNFQFLINKNE